MNIVILYMSFVEQMAQLFDQLGQGSMTGRVFAHLLICQPGKQSAKDIQDATGASVGSVHGILKSFVSAGLVNRSSESGSKKLWFEISPDAFVNMLTTRMKLIEKMVQLADAGLEEIDNTKSSRSRLNEMKICYSFFSQEFPEMIKRYENTRPTS
jgi:DNA-binding transcriptional regulator GbsR (MarR family)